MGGNINNNELFISIISAPHKKLYGVSRVLTLIKLMPPQKQYKYF